MQFYVGIFVLLMTFVLGLGLLARRLTIPYPILFVIGGLLISFIPRLPRFELNPDLIFFLFLPPLLYIQAFYTSWRDFRRELRAISLLAIGLVLATTVSVAYVAHWFIPGFSLAAGFVLGAIISPPDAVAASAIARTLGLPRRVVTVLEGESLINDSTGLVAFKISLAAVASTSPFLGSIRLPGEFFYISLGGITVGLVVGWIIARIRRQLINEDPEIVLSLSLVTPFASYLAAAPFDVSGVLAVVTTGLYLGWESPTLLNSTVRLQAQAVWGMIIYLLNGFIFVLIGLQLPTIIEGIHGESWDQLLLNAFIVNVTCIVIRFFWVFPGAYAPHFLSARVRRTEVRPEWRQVAIVGWSGMRGVVSLAAALTLTSAPNFLEAHLVQFLAFSVILTTLVFQGLTLPLLIRWLGVGDDGTAAREEREARRRLAEGVMKRIEEIRLEEKYPGAAMDTVESLYRERALSQEDELVEQLGWSDRRHLLLSVRRLRRGLITTQRHLLVSMRRAGHIGDDVMHKIEHELDLDEARLKI